ncbi:MAG: phosphodiesterase [Corynebacterium sp.]|nr:phosphodiesterase [Corynebacterium sp.]
MTDSPAITRRQFLQSTAAAIVLTVPATTPMTASEAHSWFQHGVASGDPTTHSVILWTRVTPSVDAVPGSGRGESVTVIWEVAREASISTVIAGGTVVTGPEYDHTVHIDASGLEPATRYFYRFTAPTGEHSPVGATTTLMRDDAPLASLNLAVASCANWESGHFAAYGDIARRAAAHRLDLVVFLGDYIYEYARGEFTGKQGAVRQVEPAGETITLDQYRVRYGLYRTDPHLQAAHAALPWVVMWDDHESANDSWREGAQNHGPGEGGWHARQQAALQAYLEWMPVRTTAASLLYRSFRFGELAQLSMVDLRSFRDAPPSHAQWLVDGGSANMLGSEQFSWLKTQVENSPARWNIIGSSVMFSPMQITGHPQFRLPAPLPTNLDQWDGYSHERDHLLSVLAGTGKPTLFLAGDIHSEWGSTVSADGRQVGAELVCSSISSPNVDDFAQLPENNHLSLGTEAFLRDNCPHVRHVDLDAHGYAIASLSPASVRFTWVRVEDVTRADSPVGDRVGLEWVYEHGFL